VDERLYRVLAAQWLIRSTRKFFCTNVPTAASGLRAVEIVNALITLKVSDGNCRKSLMINS